MSQRDGPRIVSIEGPGGSGIFALAHTVVSEIAETGDFDGVAWIDWRRPTLPDRAIRQGEAMVTPTEYLVDQLARQIGITSSGRSSERLVHLAASLADQHYLIVLDNADNVVDLLHLLRTAISLGASARFVLTSRLSQEEYPLVYRFDMPFLCLGSSRALLELELRRRGQMIPVECNLMERLYDTVGGMPVALRFAASQLSRWPLAALIDELRRPTRKAVEDFYGYVYKQSWLALSQNARCLLYSLSEAAAHSNDTIDCSYFVRLLPADEVDSAISELLHHSLLELGPERATPRFRIRRLTRTFLQSGLPISWNGTGPYQNRLGHASSLRVGSPCAD